MNGELSGGLKVSEKNKDIFTVADKTFAFFSVICGFAYWNLISIIGLGLGVSLFTLILVLATHVYLKIADRDKTLVKKSDKLEKGILVLIGIMGLNFFIFDGELIKAGNFLLMSIVYIYWVGIQKDNVLKREFCLYTVFDLYNQIFVVPFYNFTKCTGAFRSVFQKNAKGRALMNGLLGIIIFLPAILLVVSLLSQADAAFESLLENIKISFSEDMLTYIRQFVLGIPVAFYLFGLIYGNKYKSFTNLINIEKVDKNIESARFIPEVTIYAGLTALNFIYVVYLISQMSYFFSAFSNTLPESMTYAEYARRGFFELCAVASINIGVVFLANAFAKREKTNILKAENISLCIFTIILIITAMSKMLMYINYYGLTRMRAYTSWFMVVMIFVVIVVLLRQIIVFNGSKTVIIGGICLFLLLSYCNLDGMIAKYNIERYKNHTLERIDFQDMKRLSDGATVHLYELYKETEDKNLKEEIRKTIIESGCEGWAEGPSKNFRNFNLQSAKAEKIRSDLAEI